MQKIIFTFCLLSSLLIASTSFGQVPQKMSYQAVLRDSNNALISNTTVSMKISILQGSASGTLVFSELHYTITNALGLISIEIGTGLYMGGYSFANISWTGGPYFIKTEVDPNGGNAYSITGTQQLLSVPFAQRAQTVAIENDPEVAIYAGNKVPKWNGSALVEGTISDVNGVVGIGTNTPDGDVALHLKNTSSFTSSTTLRIGNAGSIYYNYGFGYYYNFNTYADISCKTNQNNINDRPLQFWNRNPSASSASLAYSFLDHLGSPIFTMLESGNMGIGNSSPSAKLDVNGTVKITDGTQGNGKILMSDASGNATWQAPSIFEADPQVSSTTNHKIPKWNGTALVDGTLTDSASYVGVGTTNPLAKLDVNGNVKIKDGTQGNGKVLTSDANGLASWQVPSLTAIETDPQVASTVNNKIPKWSGTELVDGNISDSASNIGIGTTNPLAKLDVNGNVKIKDGTQGIGKVFTSDANGLGSWQAEADPQISSTTSNKIPKWNGTTLTDGTIVDSASNIGIGTTSPGAKLHVNGILRTQADPSNKAIEFYKSNGTQGWEMYVFNTGLSICEQGVACDRFVVATGGNVGIGTSTPSQKFTVSNSTSTGTYTTSGWAHSSDARLKTNVKTLHNSLEKILKINGVSYNWMKEPTSNPQVGFIAQDVEKVFPEVVVVDSNGNYSMVYQNLVAPMVEAIKEQQQQIEELIKQNKALARRIESLEK